MTSDLLRLVNKFVNLVTDSYDSSLNYYFRLFVCVGKRNNIFILIDIIHSVHVFIIIWFSNVSSYHIQTQCPQILLCFSLYMLYPALIFHIYFQFWQHDILFFVIISRLRNTVIVILFSRIYVPLPFVFSWLKGS